MGHIKFSIPIAGALAVVMSLTACNDENPWGNQSEETGCISLTLDTDNEISVSKPMFRSSESEASGTLGDYVDLPKSEDFSIKLEKNDGSYSKTWTTLADFKSDADHENFKTGSYTITAFYGEKGKQAFSQAYFEAKENFTLLAGQTENVSLTATLKNSLVKVNYTDAFKAYMSDYRTGLRTEGLSDEIIFAKDETRAAFIEPVSAELIVHFTTKYNRTVDYKLGEFAPLAKTLHNVTLDVKPNSDGNASLTVTFDDTLEEENITVDLTDKLFTTPAPVITCEGFTNGATLDMLEGNASNATIKMNVKAEGIIAKATLIVESDTYSPIWGKEIDLCTADETKQQQLATAGISAIGFSGTPDKLAFLDLTQFGKSLGTGIHKISLKVEDKTGKVSETASVTLNSEPIVLSLVGTPAIVYGSGEAVLTMDYNGADAMNDINFTAVNALGNHVAATIKSCEENTSTRAFDTKRYIYTITLPNTTKSEIEVKAYYKQTKLMDTYNVSVTVPEYSISAVDAFSKYAFLQVTATDTDNASILAAIINNIAFKDKNLIIKDRDTSNGIITITGLTPASTYALESDITGEGNWISKGNLATESELTIPNGDFTSKTENGVSIDNIEVGGDWNVGAFDYQLKSSIEKDTPNEWATVNDLTAYSESKILNTWFVVPSTYVENEQAIIRTVGYHHNGTKPSKSGSFWSTNYYCTNTPSLDQLNVAPGELFLGTYSFDGAEHRTDGIGFASRPSSISFDYNYTTSKNDEDTGYALIEILDADNNKLGTKTFVLSGSGTETINFSYSKLGKKAAKLIVSFKSSNKGTSAPIYIPKGDELKEGQSLTNMSIKANKYHALATGSVLTIDNVKATYASEPSATANAVSKRKISKRR